MKLHNGVIARYMLVHSCLCGSTADHHVCTNYPTFHELHMGKNIIQTFLRPFFTTFILVVSRLDLLAIFLSLMLHGDLLILRVVLLQPMFLLLNGSNQVLSISDWQSHIMDLSVMVSNDIGVHFIFKIIDLNQCRMHSRLRWMRASLFWCSWKLFFPLAPYAINFCTSYIQNAALHDSSFIVLLAIHSYGEFLTPFQKYFEGNYTWIRCNHYKLNFKYKKLVTK